MLFMLIIFIFTCIFAVILRYSVWRNKYSQLMPGKKPGFFDILADAKDFIIYEAWFSDVLWQKKYFAVLRRRTDEYRKQKLCCLWVAYVPMVMIVKSEAVKEFIERKIYDKYFQYEWLEPLVGTGLLTSPVSKWKQRRKLLMPCFNPSVLRGFLPIFNYHAQKLVESLHDGTKKEFIHIQTPVSLVTFDIIYETMFGVKINALNTGNSQYLKSFRRLSEIAVQRLYTIWYWPNWTFSLSKNGKEMMHHVKMFHDFTRNVILKRKENYLKGQKEQNRGKHKALLDRLLDIHMETGELSEEDIMEEVNTFALAGNETVSTAIIWTLYLIGLNSNVQAKIHRELDKVFGEDTERPVMEKDLNDLQYLDCVIKETMRLYPAAPWFGRYIAKDTNICGHTLPKGAVCLVLTYFLHRDEEVFPDPEKFDPERFSPEKSLKIPEYAYVPFSAGARNCIGKTFADMEMKVILSSILRNFSIESLDARDKVEIFASFTLNSYQPIRFRIRHRMPQKQD